MLDLARPHHIVTFHLAVALIALTGLSCDSGFKEIPSESLPGLSPSPTPAPDMTDYRGSDGRTYAWRTLKIGAGGWLVGMDISPNGQTKVVRADTYGAYILDEGTGVWRQLVTEFSMPVSERAELKGEGVIEVIASPSQSSRLYMYYRGSLYRSNDRGVSWSKLTAFSASRIDANGSFRTSGQRMAVDPVNPDVIYVGTMLNGLRVSTDGGQSFQSVAAVPASDNGTPSANAGITGIAFDPNGPVVSGRSQRVIVASYGRGVYETTNAGASWSLIAGSSTSVAHGKFAPDGIYYASGRNGHIYKYASGSWTDTNVPGTDSGLVVIDPHNANRILAVRYGGALRISLDRGATWTSPLANVTRTATDIPWLGWTKEDWMSEGNMLFDPLVPDRLWFSQGIGVWRAQLPLNANGATGVAWQSVSSGIEQLVANDILSVPGSGPVLASWDRPIFKVTDPEAYPSTHGPTRDYAINMAWNLAAAVNDPNHVVALINWHFSGGTEQSGYSTNGGATWTSFPTPPPAHPSTNYGGNIAISTPQNIVVLPSQDGAPSYTLDGGQTWLSPVGLPAAGTARWHWAHYLHRHVLTADPVTPGRFYLFGAVSGLYRSDNGGANWSALPAADFGYHTWFHVKLKGVPGRAGHLFMAMGPEGDETMSHPTNTYFYRTTNAGMNWTTVSNVREVHAFGFGQAVAGASYPAIYIAGYVNNVYGIYRSDDNAASWVRIGVFPAGSLDGISTITGDADVYGKVYVGFGGSGYAYSFIK